MPRSTAPARVPRAGDEAYNVHTGFYLGRVQTVASDGSAVVIQERNGGEPPYLAQRSIDRLTFVEPLAETIARLRAARNF